MVKSREAIVFLDAPEVLDASRLIRLLSFMGESEGFIVGKVVYTFVSRGRILDLNIKHLKHTYDTDVITFQYSQTRLKADIYICPEVVIDNASRFGQDIVKELNRVVIHGFLHLVGYTDKSATEQLVMRKKEEEYLELYAKGV